MRVSLVERYNRAVDDYRHGVQLELEGIRLLNEQADNAWHTLMDMVFGATDSLGEIFIDDSPAYDEPILTEPLVGATLGGIGIIKGHEIQEAALAEMEYLRQEIADLRAQRGTRRGERRRVRRSLGRRRTRRGAFAPATLMLVAALTVTCGRREETAEQSATGHIEMASASTTPCNGCLRFSDEITGIAYYAERNAKVRLSATDLSDVILIRGKTGDGTVSILIEDDARRRLESALASEDSVMAIVGSDMPVAVLTEPRLLTLLSEGLLSFRLVGPGAVDAFEHRLTLTREIVGSSASIDHRAACTALFPDDLDGFELCLSAERSNDKVRFYNDLRDRRRRGEVSAEEADRLIEAFEQSR
jgi:hypothetical protein